MQSRKETMSSSPLAGRFIILGVKILDGCKEGICKVLKPKYYPLCDIYDQENNKFYTSKLSLDFYGKNIFVEAIVGKNGSGKTTLIEILFQVMNNVALYVFHQIKEDIINEEREALNLFASVYALIDGDLYVITSEDGMAKIKKNDQDLPLDNKEVLQNIMPKLFYTISSNYSLNAYATHNEMEQYNIRHKLAVENSWIDGLFHKNDGYAFPIVLNPYRNNGNFNVNKEYNLTTQRLAALLVDYKNTEEQFLPEYNFSDITFIYNESHVSNLYKEQNINIADVKSSKSFDLLIKVYNSVFNIKATTVIAPNYRKLSDEAYLYLAVKTLSIVRQYSNYFKFNFTFTNSNNVDFTTLVEKIKSDTSHITLKIRQTLNFICLIMAQKIIDQDSVDLQYSKYGKVCERVGYKSPIFEGLNYLDRIIASFPPPLYLIDIKMQHVGETEYLETYKMSSGEMQLILTLTTIFYHIRNLQSVPISDSERIVYKNINIVLDEIEICFHPDFQKQFVSRLLNMLKHLDKNRQCKYNVILSTHSPFILSDIPKNNVLFLEKGNLCQKEMKQTFCTNISDMLRWNFFLRDGFMGDFAAEKIKNYVRLVKMSNQGHYNKHNRKKAEVAYNELKDCIGEPLLLNQLRISYSEYLVGIGDNRQVTSQLEEILIELKKDKLSDETDRNNG